MASFKPCLGYTSDNTVVESEAVIVRQMFDRFAAGETVYGLTEWLNTTGMRPKQSDKWQRTSIRGILTNPRYAGRVVHRGEVIPAPGNWEPIITPSLFDTVQAILSDPRRRTNRVGTARKHLLSGIALCGVCGSRVRGTANAYVCPNHCVAKAPRQTEQIVEGAVRAVLAQVGSLALSGRSEDPALDARVSELRGRLASIESDYDAGLINGRRFAVATEKVQAELAEAERRRRGKTGQAATAAVLSAADPVAAFDASSLAIRRGVIETLMTIRLMKRERHSAGQFDPESVRIEWLSEAT